MPQDVSAPFLPVNAIWILLGLLIVVGNTTTAFFMWKTKIASEKEQPGTRNHPMWNLEAINVAYAIVGLNLATASIVRLSSIDELPKGACDSFGFFLAFFFHFAAVGILFIPVNKMFVLWKPFKYYGYVRRVSRVPFVVFSFCLLYGLIIGLFPLINLGEYSRKTIYTTCFLKWNKQLAVRLTGFLNIALIMLIFGFVMVNFWQRSRLIKKRRQMNVSTSHKRETIFSLTVSSLFLICWIPYTIAMLVSTYFEDSCTGDKEKATLFGITLIPLVSNPFVSFFLYGEFREQCLIGWRHFKNVLPSRKNQENRDQTPDDFATHAETTQV